MNQTPDGGDYLRLSLYCKRPDSKPDEDCAAIHRTNRRSWIVQGDRRDEPEVIAQLEGYKPWEGAVEIPDSLVRLLAEKYLEELSDEAGHGGGAPRAVPDVPA